MSKSFLVLFFKKELLASYPSPCLTASANGFRSGAAARHAALSK
jgi:hypothetical protein